jgi:hypothetical protein
MAPSPQNKGEGFGFPACRVSSVASYGEMSEETRKSPLKEMDTRSGWGKQVPEATPSVASPRRRQGPSFMGLHAGCRKLDPGLRRDDGIGGWGMTSPPIFTLRGRDPRIFLAAGGKGPAGRDRGM